MDGQVKEASVKHLKALKLDHLDWDRENSIVHNLKKFASSTDIWRVDNINLKHKGTGIHRNERIDISKTFPAVMVPVRSCLKFGAGVDIFMSPEFYLKHIFKGTPPPKSEGIVRGLFPLETNPGELTDLFPNVIFSQGVGLVMSDLPFHLMINEKGTREDLLEHEREFMEEIDKKREWVNQKQFSKLECFDEYTPEYNTCERFKEEKRRELKQREREINGENEKEWEEAIERQSVLARKKREKELEREKEERKREMEREKKNSGKGERDKRKREVQTYSPTAPGKQSISASIDREHLCGRHSTPRISYSD